MHLKIYHDKEKKKIQLAFLANEKSMYVELENIVFSDHQNMMIGEVMPHDFFHFVVLFLNELKKVDSKTFELGAVANYVKKLMEDHKK